MTDRATPETDAKLLSFDTFNGIDPWEGERFIKVVPANFARKLERELDEVRKQRDKLMEALTTVVDVARRNLPKSHPSIERKYAEALAIMKGGDDERYK
jgi:hypothetical protein